MKNVFLYVRVSTQEQANEGYSIDEQIERLKNYCKAHKWSIIKIYTDAGYSGATTDRPALKEMLCDIKKGKCDLVLVYKLDRLSRSQKDTLSLIEDHFLASNVDFISMTENFDTSSPFGRAMIGILSVFAQLEREQIKERMGMGKQGRAKDGKWHGGGYIPIGYDYKDGELVKNEYEAMQIREIHELFQSGMAFHAIERLFDKKGYVQKYGKWQTKRIKNAILNELYVGKIKYNGQIYDGTHEPIIDKKTFEKSVALYNSKDFSHYKNNGRTSYLGSLVYCKRCGARYSAYIVSDKRHGTRYSYYTCYSRRKSAKNMIIDPNCKNKIYRREELDKIIFDEISKLSNDPSYIHEIKQESYPEDQKQKELLIQKEIEKIDAQKSRFLDLYGLGEFSALEIQAKIVPLNEQKERLEIELDNLRACASDLDEQEAVELVRTWSDVLEKGTFEQIRMLINALIERIEIDGDDIDIYWKFA